MQSDWFEDQMHWLAENGYYTLSAGEIADFLNGASFPQKSVAITFNIGTAERDDYANIILPTLRKYNLKATFFLLVNGSVVLDECGKDNRFCWSELRQWQDEGLITIQAHGRTHVSYPKASKALVKADAGEAKAIIEEKLGSSVIAFAYPSDAPSPHAFPIIESLGYAYAMAGNTRADRTILPDDPQRYSLPRFYPYSNPALYPVLTGTDSLTFPQMMEAVMNEQ
jgi:peptidoglycan/xylan/chitin deacetylase (PgdA/CDA1 family)